jgi:hypothetical protein
MLPVAVIFTLLTPFAIVSTCGGGRDLQFNALDQSIAGKSSSIRMSADAKPRICLANGLYL